MSPEVQVADIQRDDAGARCTVRTGGRSYQASVSDSDAAALAPGASTEQLMRESFVFLLEREPPESILSRFDLNVITRYFPEYPKEIGRRLKHDRE